MERVTTKALVPHGSTQIYEDMVGVGTRIENHGSNSVVSGDSLWAGVVNGRIGSVTHHFKEVSTRIILHLLSCVSIHDRTKRA